MEFLRTAVASFVFTFGSLCATAAVLAHGGRWSVRLDVLTHFAPIWLAGGVLVLLLSVVSPTSPSRVLNLTSGAVAIVAAIALMAPEYLRATTPKAPTDAPRQIKLVQFNNKGFYTDADAAAAWIQTEKADVVVLEEVSRPLADALLAAGYYGLEKSEPVMIFSRAKPVSYETPADLARGPRAASAHSQFSEEDGGFSVVGVHYTWPIYGDTQQRQSERLARILGHLNQDRLIVAGDFNSTPWSFSLQAQDKRFGLERRTKALFSWPTNNFNKRWGGSPLPVLPIDQVYAGKDWKTVSVTRGPAFGSDHYPLRVVLSLQPRS